MNCCSTTGILDIFSFLVALFTLFVTIYIPETIKWEQTYSSLISDYRSYDFAVAFQSIVEFFKTECENNFEVVQKKYEEHYKNEIEKGASVIEPCKSLHYQRRLLTQFYWQLDLCARSFFIGKSRIRRDFTTGEANMLKFLYCMNQAIDNSKVLYKDISSDDLIPSPEHSNGINKYLSHIFKILKKSKRWIK